ncbi:MAG: DMT family transporter [Dehalococcoidia bacterium]
MTSRPAPLERRPVTAGAALFTLGLSVLFGANPTAIKFGLRYLEPLQIGSARFLLAGCALLAWALLSKRRILPVRSELAPLGMLAVLFVATIATTNLGQERTSVAHTVVILTTFPIWTAILSHLFVSGDRIGRAQVAGIVVSYAGVVVTFGPGLSAGGSMLQGDALIFVSSFLLGGSQVLISILSQRIELAKIVLTQAFTAGVLLFLVSVPIEGTDYELAWPLLWSLLYQGVLIGGFAFIANAWLLKTYPPSRISVVYSSQPLFGILSSWVVLGEELHSEVIAGVVLVSVGILIVQEAWTVLLRGRERATVQ